MLKKLHYWWVLASLVQAMKGYTTREQAPASTQGYSLLSFYNTTRTILVSETFYGTKWGLSPHLVPIYVAEGPHLVPITLKMMSPFGPHFEKFRSLMNAKGYSLTDLNFFARDPKGWFSSATK